MDERVHPPVTGTLRFWQEWCRKHGGVMKLGRDKQVMEICQGGIRHVYFFNKYVKRDNKYSWSSSLPVDFLAQLANAYHKANPDAWKKYL